MLKHQEDARSTTSEKTAQMFLQIIEIWYMWSSAEL